MVMSERDRVRVTVTVWVRVTLVMSERDSI